MTDWSHIGTTLRSARESRTLSTRDVSHQTRIPVKALHELEEGDLTGFPCPSYAKSFLSQYSRFLELECEEWLDEIDVAGGKLELDALALLDYDEPEDQPEPSPPLRKNSGGCPVVAAPPRAAVSTTLQPAAVFLATAILLAAGIYGFVELNKRLGDVVGGELTPTAPAPAPQPAVKPQAGPRTPSAPSPPLAANDAPPARSPARAVISEEISQPRPLAIESQPPRAVIVEE